MTRALPSWRIATAVLLALPAPCIAAGDVIEEIVVTADYRERLLADLPAGISVLDTVTIRETAVQHFEELVRIVPNMNWSGDGHRGRYFQIRGVGELAQYQGAPNPSVGFIVDDIDFSGIGSVATLYDIERVEVLRGPQGTRYGANALAGLVYIRSTAPGGPPNGNVRVTAGDDDTLGLGVAAGGNLGSTADFRVSAQNFKANGFRNNPYLGRNDTHGRDETTLRASLGWQPVKDLDLLLTGVYVDVDDGYDAFAIDNSLTVLSDHPGKDAQTSTGASLRIEWRGAPTFELTSVTAFADSDIEFSFDADWGNPLAWAPVTYDYVSVTNRQRQTLSQELRMTSSDGGRLFGGTTDWLVGVYINRLREDLQSENRGEYYDPGYDFADTLDDRLQSRFQSTNAALFGELDWPVGELGRLTTGLRLERRTTDYDDSNGLDLGPGESMIGGELRYSHSIGDRATLYAAVARGYKAGGFNLGFVPEGRRQFGQEWLWNFELGTRALLADDRLAVSAALFRSHRHEQQVETSFQLNPNDPASFVFFTDNAATGSTTGLEAEARWTPSESWEFFANLGLLRARFDEFRTPQVDLGGRDQAHAPHYTFATGTTYRHTSGFFARMELSGKDAFYFDVSHDQRSKAYWLANARLGWQGDAWTVQLFASNLFNRSYAVRGFYFGNEPPDFPNALYIRRGDPRQLGLTIDWRFSQ